jgi:hypothetical protein
VIGLGQQATGLSSLWSHRSPPPRSFGPRRPGNLGAGPSGDVRIGEDFERHAHGALYADGERTRPGDESRHRRLQRHAPCSPPVSWRRGRRRTQARRFHRRLAARPQAHTATHELYEHAVERHLKDVTSTIGRPTGRRTGGAVEPRTRRWAPAECPRPLGRTGGEPSRHGCEGSQLKGITPCNGILTVAKWLRVTPAALGPVTVWAVTLPATHQGVSGAGCVPFCHFPAGAKVPAEHIGIGETECHRDAVSSNRPVDSPPFVSMRMMPASRRSFPVER